jgi:hypothetical protein
MAIPGALSAPESWNGVAAGYTNDLVPHFELYAKDALRLAELSPGGACSMWPPGPVHSQCWRPKPQ